MLKVSLLEMQTLLLLEMLHSFFLLLVPLSRQNLQSLDFPGNKCDWTETLTSFAECSQFMVDYFFWLVI